MFHGPLYNCGPTNSVRLSFANQNIYIAYITCIEMYCHFLIGNTVQPPYLWKQENAYWPSSKIMKLLCDMTIKISKWSNL